MPSTAAASVPETPQAFDLVMRSAVSPINDVHYGRFQRHDQADEVGKLLLAADAMDSPEWGRFDVLPVAPAPILAWTDGATVWFSPAGKGLDPSTRALVDADAMLSSTTVIGKR
jgi:hypothetical protein